MTNRTGWLPSVTKKTTLYIQEIVPRTVGLDDPDDGGRGDMVTATGKGFKNGTTVTLLPGRRWEWYAGQPPEFDLCDRYRRRQYDTGSCDFEVQPDPFDRGAPRTKCGGPGYNKRATMVWSRGQNFVNLHPGWPFP